MTILVTGFEPFGKVKDNPSQRIVEYLIEEGANDIVAEILPVDYEQAGRKLLSLIEEYNPAAVMLLGVAQGRKTISLERVAININDASIADNEGKVVQGKKIAENAPVGYWSTLPLDKFYDVLIHAKIPVYHSNHAGAYLCNHVMYSALHHFEGQQSKIPCGFIHVPSVEAIPLKEQIHAIERCLDVLRAG